MDSPPPYYLRLGALSREVASTSGDRKLSAGENGVELVVDAPHVQGTNGVLRSVCMDRRNRLVQKSHIGNRGGCRRFVCR